MNDPAARRRLTWLLAIGGALLVAVLFTSIAAPTRNGPPSPTLVPQNTADQPVSEPPQAGFSLGPGDLASLGWRLGLVVIVIAGSIVLLRWWARRIAAPRSTTGFLRVVDTLPIGSNRTIHLLALGERVIAIGATQQQITMLETLTPEEAAHVLTLARAQTETLPLGEFATQLIQSLRRHEPQPTPPQETIIGLQPRD